MKRQVQRLEARRLIDFAIAAAAALALAGVGLSEISWLPFAVLATSTTTARRCLPPRRASGTRRS